MGVLQSIQKLWGGNVSQRAPSYAVTKLPTNNEWQRIAESKNYFEQYELWTYKAVKTKADSMASYMPDLYSRGKNENVKVDPETNQLLKDLYNFNPYMSLFEARWLVSAHLALVGTAIWLMVPSDTPGQLVDFYPINPLKVDIATNDKGLPSHYVFTDVDGQRHDIDQSQIVIFKQIDPGNWLKGYGDLQASRLPHNTVELAMKYNQNVFGNKGTPDGFLSVTGIDADNRRRLERRMRSKFGGVRNAGKTAVVDLPVTYTPIVRTQRELDFVKGIDSMRDAILSIHGVPKPLVGLTDSTYNNMEEAQRAYQRYTLLPMLIAEKWVYNRQLLPKYSEFSLLTRRAVSADLFFENQDPVELDSKTQAETASMLYGSGIAYLNEARKINGLSPIKGGDVMKPSTPAVQNLAPKDKTP